MKNKYRRKYDWDLLGSSYLWYDIKGRLDWINGKPMVVVGYLNIILLILNFAFKKIDIDIPEINMVVSHWGWHWFNLVSKIVFWVLFIDGIIVNALWSFTRGEYHCSYFVRLIRYSALDNKKEVKEMLSWAWFLFTHPEIDYHLQALEYRHTTYCVMNDLEVNPEAYQRARKELLKKYGVAKNEKGRYFSWNDKKYRKMLEKL